MKPITTACVIATLSVISIQQASSAILFQDTFDTGTGGWFGAGTTAPTNVGGALSWTQAGNNVSQVIARQFTPVTLAVGQTLRLSYTMVQSGSSVVVMRAGIFDFQNDIAGNGWGTGTTNIGGTVSGYYSFFRDQPNSAGNQFARAESSTISDSGDHGPLYAGSDIGNSNTTYDINDTGAITYTVLFEITRNTASNTTTKFTLSDGSSTLLSVNGSTSTIYNTFDTVTLRSTGGTSTFDNITLELIPEPSALALSALGMAALVLPRRRNS